MYTWPLIILVKAWILGGGGGAGLLLGLGSCSAEFYLQYL